MISSPRLSRDSTPSSVVASLSPSPEFIPLISACIIPSFPHFYIHRPRVVNVSTDESLPLSAYLWLASRPLPPVGRLGLPSVGAILLEPTSYCDVHTKWHLVMAEETATLERIGT